VQRGYFQILDCVVQYKRNLKAEKQGEITGGAGFTHILSYQGENMMNS